MLSERLQVLSLQTATGTRVFDGILRLLRLLHRRRRSHVVVSVLAKEGRTARHVVRRRVKTHTKDIKGGIE
jgi:hypothetical protein